VDLGLRKTECGLWIGRKQVYHERKYEKPADFDERWEDYHDWAEKDSSRTTK
jgi:hypothetical protein